MTTPTVRGKMFLQVLKNAKFGSVKLRLPNGETETYGDGAPEIGVNVLRWDVLDTLFNRGDLGLAEAIIEGHLVVDDIAGLVEWACKNDRALAQTLHGTWYGTIVHQMRRWMIKNDRSGAKKNIMSHYDLGNEFYRLWLDPSMTYSSALFTTDAQTLTAAQIAKYDRIIESLSITEKDHVLEIGCGWGGFFSHVVKKTGCKVTAISNSPQQVRFGEQHHLTENNLRGYVDLKEMDYRDLQGRFDKVVSIEMIEAVGEKHWDQYFSKIRSSLKAGGEAAIQGITIRDDLFYSYKKGTDFIQQYVFPGGRLVSDSLIKEKSNQFDLKVAEAFYFGEHYAKTLKTWRENFNKALPYVREMGFDEKFIRLWNLYLGYCEGAFRAQRINVGQFNMALAK